MKSVWAVLLLFFPAAVGTAYADSLDDRIAEQKKQLQLLDKRVEFHTRELAEAKEKEKSYLKELSKFDLSVKRSEEQIELLDLQMQKNEKLLKSIGAEISEKAKNIAKLQEILAKRCVAIFKYGGAAELNVLISAGGLTELNYLTHMMQRLAAQDRRDIETLQAEHIQLKQKELEQQRNREELAQRRRQRERERESNQRYGNQRRELLSRIEREKQVHTAAMQELEDEQQAVQKKINEYVRKKALEAEKAANRGGKKSNQPKLVSSGKFNWPLPQRQILSSFGMRVHPKFKTKTQHAGIDIPAPLGTPIKAAGGGEILYAGWLRGYGQIVIIDHGSGYSTVYAHMSKILTEEGKRVKAGAVIGKVGNTGVATGYHLHFEVRINGDAKDPLRYLTQ